MISSAFPGTGGNSSVSATSAKRHQAFELVIAVGAAAKHAQRQIDLGGSLFDQRRITRKTYRLHRDR